MIVEFFPSMHGIIISRSTSPNNTILVSFDSLKLWKVFYNICVANFFIFYVYRDRFYGLTNLRRRKTILKTVYIIPSVLLRFSTNSAWQSRTTPIFLTGKADFSAEFPQIGGLWSLNKRVNAQLIEHCSNVLGNLHIQLACQIIRSFSFPWVIHMSFIFGVCWSILMQI